MIRTVNCIKSPSLYLIIAVSLTFSMCGSSCAATKKGTTSQTKPLTGIQTPKLDTQEQADPEKTKNDAQVENSEPANTQQTPTPQNDTYPTDDQGQRVFFPPPKLNDTPNQNQGYNPNQGFAPSQQYAPNQGYPQNQGFVPNQNYVPHQELNSNNTLQGGVETSTQFNQPNQNFRPQQGQMMPPPSNNMPPPNYMQGQVNSLQFQMQRMQAQMAPFQAAAQQYQNNLNAGTNQFNLRIERPNWIPPNAYTNETMVAPYHNSNLFFWDKRSMPNRPQMVQLANSVTRYWRGVVPNPCFVLVEPMPAAPGNYVFTSRDPRAPRGWLQNTNQNSISGYPLYRYWLDNPF